MRLLTWVLILFLAATGVSRAQDHSDTSGQTNSTAASAKTQFQPIEIQTFGWGRHASNGFYYQGLPLQSLNQYESVIDPLGDAQASQLLRSSGNEDTWGTVLLVGGIVVETAGWVDFCVEMINLGNDITANSGPDLGPSLVMILGGTGLWVGGLLLDVDAGNDRYNAVNRYNYVVQQNKSVSFIWMPDANQPGLAFTQRF
jgi:hypothetical protein